MIWWIIVRFFTLKKIPCARAVKAGNEVYVIKIEKYESADTMIGRLQRALDDENIKGSRI